MGGHVVARVAAESGYADQSQLRRDGVAFAGTTLANLSGGPVLAIDDLAWPSQSAQPVSPAGLAEPAGLSHRGLGRLVE
ncbi:hypothetical protein [Kribbella sp. NPDC023855]|uniref:hypothetical protein n=1 Tax=Kribbella sp. NPDC023855 TaxID=3154698 RepID=UPI0033DD9271